MGVEAWSKMECRCRLDGDDDDDVVLNILVIMLVG